MKYKRLSDYLALMKSAADKSDWNLSKHFGEIAMAKLPHLVQTPLEKYSLYKILGLTYVQLMEYSHALNVAYKAHLIATKYHFKTAEVTHALFMVMFSLFNLGYRKQAFSQFQKIEEYFQKYGNKTSPMDEQAYVKIYFSVCYYYYLYKKDLKKVKEILEEKLSPYKSFFSKSIFFIANYYHIKGEYLIALEDYEQAAQSFKQLIKECEQINNQRGILTAKIHLATIEVRKNQIEAAIGILKSALKDAYFHKINSLIYEVGIFLIKCYFVAGMTEKAKKLEARLRPSLKDMDTLWLYEKNKEKEELFRQINRHSGKQTSSETTTYPVPDILAGAIGQRYQTAPYRNIIGKSAAMQEVYHLLERIAPTDLPILIQGETGTGKELVANAIHQNSPRHNKALMAFDCNAIPETLIESHLFGHTKDAFTGATEYRKGCIELASGSTLFMDEIGNMPPVIQTKLLRVLEEQKVRPIGGEESIPINTRFLFASNQSIEELVKKRLFREDLFYRINTIVVNLPSLRDRPEDIPPLINHFLKKYSKDNQPKEISPDILNLFLEYQWSGNVRELEGMIRKICVLYPDVQIITKSMLSESILKDLRYSYPKTKPGSTLKELKDRFEQNIIRETIKKYDGNLSEAARRLGCARRHLYNKIR